MKSKKKLVEEYIQKIISKLCYEYGASLEDARKAVEELDLLNRYKGNYDFVIYQNVSTWVNLIVNKRKKEIPKYVEPNNNPEECNRTLKKFEPDKMDIQTYNKVFLPQWTTASLFIRNLQPTLEGKCDKESLRQLQIIGWNEETKKFISDVLNLYKENMLDELKSISNKDYNTPNKDYFDKKVEEALKENTMDNYIMINGKKIELTEEQLKQLGIEVEKKMNNPFNSKFGIHESYYYIDNVNGVLQTCFDNREIDRDFINSANSFNDKDFANQIYLHELLNRKLLKYAYDNNAEDRSWNGNNLHHYIIRDNRYRDDRYFVSYRDYYKENSTVYFSKKDVAEKAVEDVVKPFMRLNPDFVW